MGKRGPAKTPTPLKLLRGERRSSRLNREAPKPEGQIRMPSGMESRARAVWRRQVRALADTGVLAATDADSLRAYCEAVARYEGLVALLNASDPLVVGQKGNLVRNPLHSMVRDNALLIRAFARDLGFVPAAREDLHAGGRESGADPFEAWMATGS